MGGEEDENHAGPISLAWRSTSAEEGRGRDEGARGASVSPSPSSRGDPGQPQGEAVAQSAATCTRPPIAPLPQAIGQSPTARSDSRLLGLAQEPRVWECQRSMALPTKPTEAPCEGATVGLVCGGPCPSPALPAPNHPPKRALLCAGSWLRRRLSARQGSRAGHQERSATSRTPEPGRLESSRTPTPPQKKSPPRL